MNVDAGLVKKLREACGAGMMDCKMALIEAAGRHGRGPQDPAQEGHGVGGQEGGSRRQRGHDRLLHPSRAPRWAC